MADERKPPGPGVAAGVAVTTTGLGWVVLALAPQNTKWIGWVLVAAGPVLAAVLIVIWLKGRRGTVATLDKWQRRSRRNAGVASSWDHFKVSSAYAMRRKAHVLRPSLAELSWWQRRRVPVTEYATPLAKVGRHTIWSPAEDVTMRVGGPRTGKTGELACRIVDAPGGVVATSTRTDLLDLTAAARALKGEIHVFNPDGLGRISSTVTWSPLAGCQDFDVAARRAADMLPVGADGDSEHWRILARPVLALMMHAAALEGLPMRAVLAWVSKPNTEHRQLVDAALSRSDTPDARSIRTTAHQFFSNNDRTQSSIVTTLMPALTWLTSARASAIGDVAVSRSHFDVAGLIRDRGTLYLLGAEKGNTSPLISALTSEIAHQARQMAERLPGQRLDPPLTIALDEAALVGQVPLDAWTADFGGRGVTLHISLQSRAQLRQRWGNNAAAIILNNTATILIYGGTRDVDDLAVWSNLSGEREDRSANRDAEGNLVGTSTRKDPVLSAAAIANLPAGTAMIVRRGMPVSVGRTVMAWKRRDIRRANRAGGYKPALEPEGSDDLEGEP